MSTLDADEQTLRELVAVFARLRMGEESWRYQSFAEAVLDLGTLFPAADWPGDRPQGGLGRCFDAATEYAEATGAIYVEGFAHAPALREWPVFEHAWCMLPDGRVADPSLPDGYARYYLGIPVAHAFRRAEQARRGCVALLAADPHDIRNPINEWLLCQGLPPGAVAPVPAASLVSRSVDPISPMPKGS